MKEIARHKGLTSLIISRTAVTDVGLREVGRLEGLRVLALCKTGLTDEGMKNIGRCKALQYLVLQDTKVTDAGVAHLRGLQRLEMLSLKGTKVTDYWHEDGRDTGSPDKPIYRPRQIDGRGGRRPEKAKAPAVLDSLGGQSFKRGW